MNNRDNKGRFLPGNNIGVKFQKGNTYNMYRPPQYRYICTNCGYCGQYHIDIGPMLKHFSNCKYMSLPPEQIQSIIESINNQYPNNVLNIIAQDYDLSDELQMAEFFSKQFTSLDRNNKKNNPLLIASLLYMADFHGLRK